MSASAEVGTSQEPSLRSYTIKLPIVYAMRKPYSKSLFHYINTINTLSTASGIAVGLSSDVNSTTASHRMNPGASALGLIYCRPGGGSA